MAHFLLKVCSLSLSTAHVPILSVKSGKKGEAQVLFQHDTLQLWHTSQSVAHFVVPVVDKETGWLRHLKHLTHAAASLADP